MLVFCAIAMPIDKTQSTKIAVLFMKTFLYESAFIFKYNI